MVMLSHSGHTLMHVYTKIKHANNLLLRFSHVIYAITSPVLPTTLTLKNDIKSYFFSTVLFISLDTQTQQTFQNDFSFIIQQTTRKHYYSM